MNGRIDCDALPPESLSGSNTAFSTAGIGNIREFWERIILKDLVLSVYEWFQDMVLSARLCAAGRILKAALNRSYQIRLIF